MTTLSSVLPGRVKSVQRDVVTLAVSATNATQTISAVNINKSVLNFLGWRLTATTTDLSNIPAISFTNSTTISADRSGSTVLAYAHFEVIEFY